MASNRRPRRGQAESSTTKPERTKKPARPRAQGPDSTEERPKRSKSLGSPRNTEVKSPRKVTNREKRPKTSGGESAKPRTESAEAPAAKASKAPKKPPASHNDSKQRPETAAVKVAASSAPDLPPFSIVGIGASAGGLDALSTVVANLPEDLGLAIVIIQHLSPQHESALPLLLGNKTKLPVVQATEGVSVVPNHIFVIPPNAQMRISDGKLHLSPRATDHSKNLPIDFFLRSLAEYAQSRAVAVILSGTAADGAVGVCDVKSMGGMTIAQQPETAKHTGMPMAAMDTQMVDLVLPPQEIATALAHIGRYFLEDAQPESLPAESSLVKHEHLLQVFALLRTMSGVDFKQYKLPTIERRLHRRMVLTRLVRIEDYIRYLQENPEEVKQLYRDILISVTRFFREPESFKVLAEHVFPALLANQTSDAPIRIWVSGCASGEEAYSVAITFLEFLGNRAGIVPIQIFATDLSEPSIDQARLGMYPESIAADVSRERLRRYFNKIDGGFRINKTVRDLCVFARHDLTRDPPFSKLDLVLCRNVLIYMSAELQRRIITLFHYSLKPHGFLMLGQAETIGPYADLFTVKDKKHRVYAKKLIEYTPAVSFQIEHATVPMYGRKLMSLGREGQRSIQHEANQIMLDRFAPPAVIVDSEFQVIQFCGQTGLFLEPPPGEPSNHLFKMAREGLLYGLRTALHAARKTQSSIYKDGLRVRSNGGWRDVNLEIVPLEGAGKDHYLVLFRAPALAVAEPHDSDGGTRKSGRAEQRRAVGKDDEVERLQKELAASREYLQSIIQELEAANEELQSANEEILSSNEELQSTNEELDTAKEELQSTNEELSTVNEELHNRNEELSSVNSDLVNLLGSVQIAIVIVASDLRIRRFTPMAEKVLNLIPSDIGRPISHIKPNIDCPDLERMISEAVDTVSVQEREVQDRQGNWFSLRIRSYKDVENRIDGAVLTLFDIDAVKRHQNQIRDMHLFVKAVVETAYEPMLVLDTAHRIQAATAAFCRMFAVTMADIEGRLLYEVIRGGADKLREVLEAQLPTAHVLHDYAIDCELPHVGRTSILTTASLIRIESHSAALILLAIERGPA